MNMTVGTGTPAVIGPANSFLTVKNAVNNGNSKNNNKAYMQHLKSADEAIVEKRGVLGGTGALGNKSDAATAADTSHMASSMN
jgi:acetyl-CoA carboxylase beta subunit